MLDFGELSCNIVDGLFYAKVLDAEGNETIVAIGGKQYEKVKELDPDNIQAKTKLFETLEQLEQHLSDPQRYAGQIVTCKEAEGKIFVLSNNKDQWLIAAGNEDNYDKHFAFPLTHTMEEIILHNLGKEPAVEILDQQGNKCIADIKHIDQNNTKISFNNYFTGKVTFN